MRQHAFVFRMIGSLMLLVDLMFLPAHNVEPSRALAQETSSSLPPRPSPPLPPRPEPTANPAPSPPEDGALPDIRWSQALSISQSAEQPSVLSITVRAVNLGDGDGSSNAILAYDPEVLQILDATPMRSTDWVRARDDAAGMLTLAIESLASEAEAILQLRFFIQQETNTIVHLVRADGRDRANPLFLNLARLFEVSLNLMAEQHDTTLTITGRGYKPGEKLAVWANTRQDGAITIEDAFVAMNDDDGSVSLTIPMLDQGIVSVVVYGQISEVTSVVEVPSA
jgi:hypothetical protein